MNPIATQTTTDNQSTPAETSAKPVSAEQLVASSESRESSPPASPSNAEPAAKLETEQKKTGRPLGKKDSRPRKPRYVQIRNAQGKIVGNVPPPPGTPPAQPKLTIPADFSDVEQAGNEFSATDELNDQGLDTRATAEVTFDTGTTILTMVFGKEWQPKSKDERESVIAAIHRYYDVKGVRDIPPGVALTLVLATYSVTRFHAPETSSKIKLAWSWLRAKWQNFRARRRVNVPVIRAETPTNQKTQDAITKIETTVTATTP